MSAATTCPHCGTTLSGREIGYSVHDYIQFWICPECGGTWNRWPADFYRYERAEQLRAEYNAERVA